MAKIIADRSQFIVIGAWNPAILQGEWLTKEFPDITPSPLNVEIDIQTNNIRFDFDDFYLSPSSNRLAFIPKNDLNENTLSRMSVLAKGIYQRLVFTPISAAGSNFFFQLDKDEEFSSEEVEKVPVIKNLPNNLVDASLTFRSIKHTLSKSDFNTNIIYEIKGQERSLIINFEHSNSQNIMEKAAEFLIDNFNCANNLAESLIVRN
ncbi:hypothetical protein [Methylobacter tundripaludum]|uniref:Uncharacterized protein n=1 Tax=Methylobacter tundripaludum (strain ATCC BAA-1195 / DSM 17260 / SV96) TaxID=697282 RepID=G3J0A5_METTV|nr:hypothetical protein [Methylobacter tundripaludum]EGW20627.1 hypothetical protein Mettu_3775 [Methylobacter tundripaludum SV96]